MKYEIKGGAFPVVQCYLANGEKMIAFGASFPGQIIPVEVGAGRTIVVQKGAFLASGN